MQFTLVLNNFSQQNSLPEFFSETSSCPKPPHKNQMVIPYISGLRMLLLNFIDFCFS